VVNALDLNDFCHQLSNAFGRASSNLVLGEIYLLVLVFVSAFLRTRTIQLLLQLRQITSKQEQRLARRTTSGFLPGSKNVLDGACRM
jgi:hypothetical protein